MDIFQVDKKACPLCGRCGVACLWYAVCVRVPYECLGGTFSKVVGNVSDAYGKFRADRTDYGAHCTLYSDCGTYLRGTCFPGTYHGLCKALHFFLGGKRDPGHAVPE